MCSLCGQSEEEITKRCLKMQMDAVAHVLLEGFVGWIWTLRLWMSTNLTCLLEGKLCKKISRKKCDNKY